MENGRKKGWSVDSHQNTTLLWSGTHLEVLLTIWRRFGRGEHVKCTITYMWSTMDPSRCVNQIEEAQKESISMFNTPWAGSCFLHKDENFVFNKSSGYQCVQKWDLTPCWGIHNMEVTKYFLSPELSQWYCIFLLCSFFNPSLSEWGSLISHIKE